MEHKIQLRTKKADGGSYQPIWEDLPKTD